MDIEIKEIEEWKKLRIKLNQDYSYNDEWEKAINLFCKLPLKPNCLKVE
jgi:hypothetical protein